MNRLKWYSFSEVLSIADYATLPFTEGCEEKYELCIAATPTNILHRFLGLHGPAHWRLFGRYVFESFRNPCLAETEKKQCLCIGFQELI